MKWLKSKVLGIDNEAGLGCAIGLWLVWLFAALLLSYGLAGGVTAVLDETGQLYSESNYSQPGFLGHLFMLALPIWCILAVAGIAGIALGWRLLARFRSRKPASRARLSDAAEGINTATFTTRIKPGKAMLFLRIAWLVLFTIFTPLAVAGLIGQANYVHHGTLQADLAFQEVDGKPIVLIASDQIRQLGIRLGDEVLNPDIPMFGASGEAVSLELKTAGEEPRSVEVTYCPVQPFARIFSYYGLPLTGAVWYYLLTRLSSLLVFLLAAALFVRYRSDDWLALITAAGLLALWLQPNQVPDTPSLTWVYDWLNPLIMLLALIFPTGRFSPRRAWLLLAAYVGKQLINIGVNLLYSGTTGANLWLSISTILDAGFVVAACGIIVHRYRKEFTLLQRQQAKWVFLALAVPPTIGLISVPVSFLVMFVYGNIPTVLLTVQNELVWFSTVGVPLGFAFAVLRYRLYDVDVIINRSLVYSLLSIALLAVFGLQFFLLHTGITTFLGNQSAILAAGVSGVVTTALFGPSRQLARQFVDRRIYRLRYDLDEIRQAQRIPAVKTPGALSGKQFGEFMLLDVVGCGGMGEVYQGQDPQTGRLAAVKVLPSNLADQPDFHRRFEREAESMAMLSHPNIVRFFGVGQAEGYDFLAMEFIVGRSLSSILKERQRLTLAEAGQYFPGLVQAVDYIHSLGLVHRDLKPSNIMLRDGADGSFESVLMDFGISKVAVERSALTGSGVIGTIQYMAPEQIRSASDVDYRADLYALGAIFYEALTGRLPFEGNLGQVLFGHLQAPPPDPLQINPELPPATARAILRALKKAPEQRFASAAELFDAITSESIV
ncbi:MAG: serine/threonine-protein kinase [Chloroflexota bacterium]